MPTCCVGLFDIESDANRTIERSFLVKGHQITQTSFRDPSVRLPFTVELTSTAQDNE